MTHTVFTGGRNPFKAGEPYPFVPAPNIPAMRKGSTRFDTQFLHMIETGQAMLLPEADFDSVRKAFQRFEVMRGIKGSHSFRRQHDPRTKTYTVWLECRKI